MGRLLIWLLMAALVWWAWRARQQPPAKTNARPAPPPAPTPRMVCCQHCGVHLPAEDGVRDAQGQAYCCTDHRTLGPGPQA